MLHEILEIIFMVKQLFFIKLLRQRCVIFEVQCVQSVKNKTEQPYLFQYKLSYRNLISTNNHGLLSTSNG